MAAVRVLTAPPGRGGRCALLRADGSQRLGMGHIARCAALAWGFTRRGVRCVAAVRGPGPRVRALLAGAGAAVEALPERIGFERDAALTAERARRHGARVVVTDLSHHGTLRQLAGYRDYLDRVRRAVGCLVMIDGLAGDAAGARIRLSPDAAVLPYFGAERSEYRFSEGTRLLLGPRYFAARPELLRLRGRVKAVRKAGRNVLVTLGGADPAGATARIVRSLARRLGGAIRLRVIVGEYFSAEARGRLEGLRRAHPGSVELLEGASRLAACLRWADVAVTTGGITKYETALAGTPDLIVSQFPVEARVAEDFQRAGTARHAGSIRRLSQAAIARAVRYLLSDYGLRRRMSAAGRRLVDGRGADRMLAALPWVGGDKPPQAAAFSEATAIS